MENPNYIKAIQEQLSLAAETSLLYLRSLLRTDATQEEINILLHYYLELLVFGRAHKPESYSRRPPKKEQDDE